MSSTSFASAPSSSLLCTNNAYIAERLRLDLPYAIAKSLPSQDSSASAGLSATQAGSLANNPERNV